MKIGFNLFRHLLNPENFQFARQAGATHVIVHIVDYHGTQAVAPHKDWTLRELKRFVRMAHDAGLEMYAIENFEPAHWFDILLDGPSRKSQLQHLKKLIANVGEAGIPVIGYNFSIAGACGRVQGPYARGRAESMGMNGPCDDPLPSGMVWNTRIDHSESSSVLAHVCTHQQLWDRIRWFLDEVIPVAERAGVHLAAHADNPPLPELRGTPRMMYRPEHYLQLLQMHASQANQVAICLGAVAEMADSDVYETTDQLTREGRVAYIQLRNVVGKVPYSREVFPDEGDVDFQRVFQILRRNRFDGVLVPRNAPSMRCDAPWHAGMAFSVGYAKGLLHV